MGLVDSEVVRAFSRSWKDDVADASRRMVLAVRAIAGDGFTPTFPELSSMTVVFDTPDGFTFDTDAIREAALDVKETPSRTAHEVSLKIAKTPGNTFRKQATFTYTCPGEAPGVSLRRSVMLFAKGTIHVAGARGIMDAAHAAQAVIDTIDEMLRGTGLMRRPETVAAVRIALLNTDFRLGAQLGLQPLLRLSASKYGIGGAYNTDVHPAAKMRFRGVTIMVFSTGSVIITGSKTMLAVSEAYAFLLGLVADNKKDLLLVGPGATQKRPQRKSKRSYIEFARNESSEIRGGGEDGGLVPIRMVRSA